MKILASRVPKRNLLQMKKKRRKRVEKVPPLRLVRDPSVSRRTMVLLMIPTTKRISGERVALLRVVKTRSQPQQSPDKRMSVVTTWLPASLFLNVKRLPAQERR